MHVTNSRARRFHSHVAVGVAKEPRRPNAVCKPAFVDKDIDRQSRVSTEQATVLQVKRLLSRESSSQEGHH